MFYETISILKFVERWPTVVFLGCRLRSTPWILIYSSHSFDPQHESVYDWKKTNKSI